MFTLTKGFDDEGEVDKGGEHQIEFVDAGRCDESPSLDGTAARLRCDVCTTPGRTPKANVRAQRRNDGDEAEIERELSGFVAFVRLVHQQVQRPIRRFQTFEQCSSVRRVAGRAPGSFSLMSLSLAIQTNRG